MLKKGFLADLVKINFSSCQIDQLRPKVENSPLVIAAGEKCKWIGMDWGQSKNHQKNTLVKILLALHIVPIKMLKIERHYKSAKLA